MNVQHLGNHHAWGHYRSLPREVPSTSGATQTASGYPGQTPRADSGKQVLDQLQTGHFQGVADIRLRINFQQELQQNTGQDIATIEQGTSSVSNAVDAKLQDLLGNSEVSAALDDFAKTLTVALDRIVTDAKSGQISPSSALEKIKSAFSDLADSISSAQAMSANQEAEEQNGPEATEILIGAEMVMEDAEEPAQQVEAEETGGENIVPSDFSSALNSLKTWLADHATDMQKNLQEAQSMPSPHRSHGHGRSFQQFLDAYASMSAATGAGATSSEQAAAIDAMI